ncbi:MAG TPA: Fe-Mn family superoxide dismutase [Methylomirabilota bacterium]|nr:Fe-Mn family superoxide dismutase [Methylomirabilota bacterium]
MSYSVQERIKPKALQGISDEQIRQHWALYEGYVKNVNGLIEDLERAEIGSRSWAELKRRAGFEFNGMALHEYYFGNLAAGSQLSAQSALASELVESWGTVEVWRQDFAKTGAMRGVGWAILYRDPMGDRLFNWWIGDHELNHPAGCHPIIVLDVFEHAWMVDYGAGGRDEYIRAFLENVCWEVVEQRHKDSRAGHTPARF